MLKWPTAKFNFWQYLVNFWSGIYLILIIWDFINDNFIIETLEIFGFIYIGVLAIYVGNKEFERWYNKHHAQHPGEIFVIVWTALVMIIVCLDLVLQKSYHLPSSVISSYIAVLTILAVTEKSKALHQRKYPIKKTGRRKTK
jgi:phosphotransferase system  glucose/maltose/N-acetylglucosamine-specific IIC component